MKDQSIIRDEELLVIELCRLEFIDVNLAKIRSLIARIEDWKYFRYLTNVHGVAALSYHNLEKHKLLGGIPEETVTFLRGSLLLSLCRNTFNSNAMGDALCLLNREKIKTVLLKGFALENCVYGSAGLRQMSDIDILTDRKDCIQARNILIRNGYVSLPVKSPFHRLITTYIGKHLPSLIKNGTSIEIHHDLFGNRCRELTKMLYETTTETEIHGEKAYIPSPQIFFLYLIRHLYLHEMKNESQLRLYTDLIVLIEKHRIEILNNDLLTYASVAGLSDILAIKLEYLRDLWGVQFPGWLDEYIRNWHNEDSLDRFILFLKNPKGNPTTNKEKIYRQMISDIPGIHRKLIFILGDIFPSISFMIKRYNCSGKWSALLYYPHRLGKIIWLLRK